MFMMELFDDTIKSLLIMRHVAFFDSVPLKYILDDGRRRQSHMSLSCVCVPLSVKPTCISFMSWANIIEFIAMIANLFWLSKQRS